MANFPQLNKLKRVVLSLSALANKYKFEVPMKLCELYLDLNKDFKKLCDEFDKIDIDNIPIDEISEFNKLQRKFHEIFDQIKLVETEPVPDKPVSKAASNFIKPQLQIPTFSGDLKEWNAFKNVFDAVVHSSKDYSDEEKYFLLLSYLGNDARTLVENFANTLDAYQAAYRSLLSRYDNPRYHAYSLYTKLANFEPSEDLQDTMKRFSVELGSVKRSLFNLKMDHADFLVTMLCLQKLPARVRSRFENSISNAEIPKFDQLIDFVTNQEKSLEVTALTKDSEQLVINSSIEYVAPTKMKSEFNAGTGQTFKPHLSFIKSNASMNDGSCILCRIPHQLYKCELFKREPVNTRLEIVRQHKRCYACLGSHLKANCNSTSSCKNCKSIHHHTLLCNNKNPQALLATDLQPSCSNRSCSNQVPDSSSMTPPSSDCYRSATVTVTTPSSRPISSSYYRPPPPPGFSSPPLPHGSLSSPLPHHGGNFISPTSFPAVSSSDIPHAVSPPVSNSGNVLPAYAVEIPDTFSGCAQVKAVHASALLGTAVVTVLNQYNQQFALRAVLDCGSMRSIITLRAAIRMGLNVMPAQILLNGISEKRTAVKGTAHLTLMSRPQFNTMLETDALVLEQIAGNLPAFPINTDLKNAFSHLDLADPAFDQPDEIDLLIGADIYPNVFVSAENAIIPGTPAAFATIFGYVLSGKLNIEDSPAPLNEMQLICTMFAKEESLSNVMNKFWETEDITPDVQISSPADEYCENLYKSTTQRTDDGRYVVSLPFKPGAPSLSSNRKRAYQNHLGLLKRLNKSSELEEKYSDFMNEYRALGHLGNASSPADYVIPHHAVFKNNDPSQKIRVVFNASSKDTNGNSLNDILLPGPKLQANIVQVLTRFRTYKYVILSDCKQMYRQILLHANDCKYQHIFWKPSPEQSIQEFELKTVTYGVSSSAYLAQCTLQQLVTDEGEAFPLASKVLSSQTYVDDLLGGSNDFSEAQQLVNELIELLACGSFELRKWNANTPALISHLPDAHLENKNCLFDASATAKVLGIVYNPLTDNFRYFIDSFDGKVTKRSILSFIARIYDPLGWLTPLILLFKLFMRTLWSQQLDWDTPVPEPLRAHWASLIAEITSLSAVTIPRLLASCHVTTRLLGFADASEKGFAACLYLHEELEDQFINCHLIAAKSHVAPLKTMTIPRLELMGCLLLARLLSVILPTLTEYTLQEICLYTDSKTALDWINTPTYKLQIFVANRVQQITQLTRPELWNHVISANNCADVASRGLSPTEIVSCRDWWHASTAFRCLAADFPVSNHIVNEVVPEMKTNPLYILATVEEEPLENPLYATIERVSEFGKLCRIFSYVLRFINRIKLPHHEYANKLFTQFGTPDPPDSTDILTCESEVARLLTVSTVQRMKFQKEISMLKNGKCPKHLLALQPYIDENGLIRLSGRLEQAPIPNDTKNPLLLPKNEHLSALIINHHHLKNCHAGPRTTQASVCQQYWIMSARNQVRRTIHGCITCNRFRHLNLQQQMAPLPAERVTVSKPFNVTGLDFAGPFMCKTSLLKRTQATKGYLCIFVCFTTKATHLEFMSAMSTPIFMAALQRFIARRGAPHTLFSDNAKTFLATARKLQAVSKLMNSFPSDLNCFLANHGINWKFIPPYAPHHGGIWEATVKSAKALLHRCIGDTPLTHEEYTTIFTRIESILNSRPLTDLSSQPTEAATVLTPGHFLVGGPLTAPPQPIENKEILVTRRWRYLNQMTQHFWSRWSKEYLSTLLNRSKWQAAEKNLQLNDLVVIKSIHTSPLNWPIGRVVALHPGKDGLVRVATIKCASGNIVRAISKIHRI